MAEYDFHFTAEVMDGIFAEVITARGAWDTLGERLDNIEQGAGGDTYTKAEVDTMLAEKVDKVDGKGLSTNDFTNADKAQITTNKNNISTLLNVKRIYKVPIASVPVNNFYFGVQMFPYELPTTNGLAIEVKSIGQGGISIDTSKFTTQINTWGFRIYTTDSTYAGVIPDVEIKAST